MKIKFQNEIYTYVKEVVFSTLFITIHFIDNTEKRISKSGKRKFSYKILSLQDE